MVTLRLAWHQPTNTDVCKKNIAEATGLMGPEACATIVIQWTFRKGCYASKSVDPRASLPLEQLKAWIEIWNRSDSAAKERIANSWHKLHRTLPMSGPNGTWSGALPPQL